MILRDDVVKVLQSRGRVEGGTEEPGPHIVNLTAAVRELQDAVVRIAEWLDERTEGEWERIKP
jgi:hypothetical protein